MNPCQKCLENNWRFYKKRDIDDEGIGIKWVEATCQACGNVVEFGFKNIHMHFKKMKAQYKIKKGKRYLKIGKKYVEVYLKYFDDGSFKVTPIGE